MTELPPSEAGATVTSDVAWVDGVRSTYEYSDGDTYRRVRGGEVIDKREASA